MRLTTLFIFILFAQLAQSQDVMLQGWYWDYPKTANGALFADTLKGQAGELQQAGFTHIWLPPLSRASFGSNSNGYDPKDLYDLGEYGLGPTGFGSRSDVDALISEINSLGMEAVADVVYNHRDGGSAELNPAVEGWVENMNCSKVNNGDNPFPSDRMRNYLPVGGATGNVEGTYYFKVRSASKHPYFYNKPYVFYAQTNTVGYQGNPALNENEGNNGGGDCGQSNDVVYLGVDMNASVDDVGDCNGWCGIDEFALTLNTGDFDPAGDTVWIYMTNQNGQYSDHYIYGLWATSRSADIQSEIKYQTYTDFTAMPSGQGAMNYLNFKPNGNPTNLGGDWDAMYFFNDYDQNVTSTQTTLIDWSQWLWDDVGIRGLRMDAVKHFDPAFVGLLMDSLHQTNQNPSMVVGEFYDSNAGLLANWVNDVEANMSASAKSAIDVQVFDFALRQSLESACDAFGYDARNVFDSGIVNGAGASSTSAVTFVNNHDFRDFGQPIDNDPLLAYAYILTNRAVGTPCVFYPDYYGIELPEGPVHYLKPDIDQLMYLQTEYMEGGSVIQLNNFGSPGTFNFASGYPNTSLIYQTVDGGMSNNRDAIVLINFAGEPMDVDFAISGTSSKPVGTVFYDLTGKSLTPTVELDANKRLRVVVPARSYAVMVDASVDTNCQNMGIVYVDANATGLNNGSSWVDAYTNLAAAIAKSNTCADLDTIFVKEGTYKTSYLDNRENKVVISDRLHVFGGFPSAIDNPDMMDRDPENFPSILDGDIGMPSDATDNSFHSLSVAATDTVWINGIQLMGGNADGMTVDNQLAGGILHNSPLFLEQVKVINCQASGEGSAIYSQSNAFLKLTDCTIDSNPGTSQIYLETGSEMHSKSTMIID